MSIPKEPRQIMINLMYLVLTALLALNVSNEILNAFRTLSMSINKSNESIDQKNKELYASIIENEKAPGQAEKVRPYREKADQAVKVADDMVAYFEQWKKKIVIEAGGYSKEDPQFPDRMDNIDATTLLLVEKKGGDEMKSQIEKTRNYFLELVSANDRTAIAPLMPLKVDPVKKNDHNPTGDWSIGNFEHMPAIAALALFSKFQNDVRASEALIVKQLFDEAHMKEIKFDTMAAVAVPKQSYALEGDKIEASILLAAFNRHLNPTIGSAGGGSTKPAQAGVIPWETVAHGVGMQTVQGTINLQTEQGNKSFPWKFQYMVGTTGASMGLDKMNVFYIGVPNPVTIAAAGYSVEDVSLSIPGATVTGEKGHYVVTVDKIGKVQATINAKTKEGAIKPVGGMEVRVKRIPDPVAKLGGVASGNMPASTFRVQIAPAAILDNFDFDTKFVITHISVMILPKGKDIMGPFEVTSTTGCRLDQNPSLQKAIAMCRPGDRVFIDEIKAVGPDKQIRKLNSIVLLLIN